MLNFLSDNIQKRTLLLCDKLCLPLRVCGPELCSVFLSIFNFLYFFEIEPFKIYSFVCSQQYID